MNYSIELEDICLKYPDGTYGLNNVDIKVKKGDLIYLVGESGSGKTSLLKLLLGIEYKTSGKLRVLGEDLSRDNKDNIRKIRQSIGPVFQEFKLIKGRTAMENIIMGIRFLDIGIKDSREYAEEIMSKVGLSNKKESLVENLSYGERQRVAIARAIIRKPKIILADEPTGNLDKKNAINILNLFTELKDEKTTIIITTHATDLIEKREKSIIYNMNNGKLTQLLGGF